MGSPRGVKHRPPDICTYRNSGTGEKCYEKRVIGSKFCETHWRAPGGARDEKGIRRCGARKRDGKPCKSKCVVGSSRCRMHGGHAPRGPLSSNYRNGRTSKYMGVLPPDLADKLDTSRVKDIISGRAEIQLLDARTAQILEDIRNLDPTGQIKGAQLALISIKSAVTRGDFDDANEFVEKLMKILDKQKIVAAGWEEIRKTLDMRDKLAKTEIAHQKLLSEKIQVEQVDAFMRAVIAEVRTLTDDQKKLQIFANRVIIAGRGTIGPALGLPSGLESDTVEAEIVESRS